MVEREREEADELGLMELKASVWGSHYKTRWVLLMHMR